MAMLGGTDALRATTMWDPDQADKKARVRHGDSFIMLVRWDKDGALKSESIQPYGAATTRPESPHYTDQMKLFVAGKYKPVHFEWADAVKNAKAPLSSVNAVCRNCAAGRIVFVRRSVIFPSNIKALGA